MPFSLYTYILSDASGSNYDDGYGRGARRPPPPRKEKDDKVHDSIIEERIQRERPCRILFIRNIKASVPLLQAVLMGLQSQFANHCIRLTLSVVRDQ